MSGRVTDDGLSEVIPLINHPLSKEIHTFFHLTLHPDLNFFRANQIGLIHFSLYEITNELS